jgi:hypothetical protein
LRVGTVSTAPPSRSRARYFRLRAVALARSAALSPRREIISVVDREKQLVRPLSENGGADADVLGAGLNLSESDTERLQARAGCRGVDPPKAIESLQAELTPPSRPDPRVGGSFARHQQDVAAISAPPHETILPLVENCP